MWKVEYKKRFLKELSNLPDGIQAQAENSYSRSVYFGEVGVVVFRGVVGAGIPVASTR